MRNKENRIISFMLALIMITGMIPGKVLAKDRGLPVEVREVTNNERGQENTNENPLKEYKAYEKIDWKSIQEQVDPRWPILPGQVLKPVEQNEAIKMVDLNYVGQYKNGDGRDVVRLEFRIYYAAPNNNTNKYKRLELRFDEKLKKLIDWGETCFITQKANRKKVQITKPEDPSTIVNSDDNGAYALNIIDTLYDGENPNSEWLYHTPLDIVLKENTYLSSIGRDTFVQARLTDESGINVFTRPIEGELPNYTRYTLMSGIPTNSNHKNIFRTGEFNTSGKNVFSYVYNKVVGLTIDYSDKSLATGKDNKEYNSLIFRHDFHSERASKWLEGNNEPYGLMYSFDDSIVSFLKNEIGDDEVIGEISHYVDGISNNKPPIQVKRKNINIDEDAGRAFIILRRADAPVSLPEDYKVIEIPANEWKEKLVSDGVKDISTNVLTLTVDVDKMGESLNKTNESHLNLAGKVAYIVNNTGWTDFEAEMKKDMNFGDQSFFVTELSESLGGNERENQIMYKFGSAENYLVETMQGYLWGVNNRGGYINGRLGGIDVGGRDNKFYYTRKSPHAEEGNKFLTGGRTLKSGEKVTVHIPNKPNYAGNITMWGVNFDKTALENEIYGEPNINNNQTKVKIYNARSINKVKVSYFNETDSQKQVVEYTSTNSDWGGNSADGVIYTPGGNPRPIEIDISKINFKDDVVIEYFQGAIKKGTVTISKLPEFTRKNNAYNLPTYLYKSDAETPFLIGKTEYVPLVETIFTDAERFKGYSRFSNSRVRMTTVDPNNHKNVFSYVSSSNNPKLTTFDGEQYNAYSFELSKPAELEMIKDMPLYFSNNKLGSIQSDYKIDKIRARVKFDLNGGSLENAIDGSNLVSYNTRTFKTDPVERIVPDNKYYVDTFSPAQADGARNALKYQKNSEGKAVQLVDAGENYQPNGFVGDNIQFIDINTGKNMTLEEKALRKMLEEEPKSSDENLAFLGWSTKANTTQEQWKKMTEAKTLDEVNNSTKAYKFTESSPVDRYTTVYAVYGVKDSVKAKDLSQKYDEDNDVQLIVGNFDLELGQEVDEYSVVTLVKEYPENTGKYIPVLDAQGHPITGTINEDGNGFKFILRDGSVNHIGQLDETTTYKVQVAETEKETSISEEGLKLDITPPTINLGLELDDFGFYAKLICNTSDEKSNVLKVNVKDGKDSPIEVSLNNETGFFEKLITLDGQANIYKAIAIDTMGNKSAEVEKTLEVAKEKVALNMYASYVGENIIFVQSVAETTLKITIVNKGNVIKLQDQKVRTNDYEEIKLLTEDGSEYKLQRRDRVVVKAENPNFEPNSIVQRVR